MTHANSINVGCFSQVYGPMFNMLYTSQDYDNIQNLGNCDVFTDPRDTDSKLTPATVAKSSYGIGTNQRTNCIQILSRAVEEPISEHLHTNPLS